MTLDPRTPVLVGAGQITRRTPERDGDPASPLDLMERAARAALDDSGGGDALLRRVASVCVLDSIGMPVPDPGALLAERLAIAPRETLRSGLGGNGPQLAVAHQAERIATGELDVALIAGAEAMDTLMPLARRGERPDWPSQPDGIPEAPLLAEARQPTHDAENAAGLIAPVIVYPFLEHALRAVAGRSPDEHSATIAALWARFAAVAAGNPHAWDRSAPDAATIATPSERNRRVSSPYTKLMNANLQVDQGVALVLCSVEAARAAGVARERWVFPHAGVAANDIWFLGERPALHASPALRVAGRALLGAAGIGIDDVGHLDLYSCFPSAVQIAGAELGVDLHARDRAPTMTGGLTFAGGPGNAYSAHAIATLAGRLREDHGAYGLVSALGWYMTRHALGLYCTEPPPAGYRTLDVQAEVDAAATPRALATDGEGAIETYTALYERDGRPGMGIVAALRDDGARALGKSHDAGTLDELLAGDPLGRRVRISESRFAFI